jgi:hypothetical protein
MFLVLLSADARHKPGVAGLIDQLYPAAPFI